MKINEPVTAGKLMFSNPVIMPPMATAKADSKGHITEEALNYYREKTSCRLFSAVIVEHSYVDPAGKAHENQNSISNDSDIQGMSRLSQVIKESGAISVLQISHSGSMAREKVIGQKPLAPSALINPGAKNGEMPVQLTREQIEELENRFVDAAERAMKAGFDAVEIHSAHGYLLDQFLSPLTNKREDEYGGDVNGRIRMHLNIIEAIRKKMGDFPIFVRMGAGDYMEGGLSREDSVTAAKAFVKAGADVIDVSGGLCFYTIADTRPGYFDTIAEPIHKVVDVPVILTGGVRTAQDIEDILNRDVCSLVGVGRSVFRDSQWMEDQLASLLREKE